MAMTYGIHIGHMGGPLDEMRKLWKFADANGFDWFSVSDHFQESPPRGGDLDCYEAISTLAAAAVATPAFTPKSLTTIDHLSGGRVDCGIGAGWHDVEAKAFGLDFPRIGVREDMLEEYAQCLRLLFDPEGRLENAPNFPKPLQPRVPIWIGGKGEIPTPRSKTGTRLASCRSRRTFSAACASSMASWSSRSIRTLRRRWRRRSQPRARAAGEYTRVVHRRSAPARATCRCLPARYHSGSAGAGSAGPPGRLMLPYACAAHCPSGMYSNSGVPRSMSWRRLTTLRTG
jgi:hypothetical protein